MSNTNKKTKTTHQEQPEGCMHVTFTDVYQIKPLPIETYIRSMKTIDRLEVSKHDKNGRLIATEVGVYDSVDKKAAMRLLHSGADMIRVAGKRRNVNVYFSIDMRAREGYFASSDDNKAAENIMKDIL